MPVTHYIWDEVNDTLLMEKDEAGNTIAEYTHEPGQYGPLISQHRNGQIRYHNYDGQGSTRALTDESGAVTDTYTYTAFGETVAKSGVTTNPFGYKGALGYYVNPETASREDRRGRNVCHVGGTTSDRTSREVDRRPHDQSQMGLLLPPHQARRRAVREGSLDTMPDVTKPASGNHNKSRRPNRRGWARVLA